MTVLPVTQRGPAFEATRGPDPSGPGAHIRKALGESWLRLYRAAGGA